MKMHEPVIIIGAGLSGLHAASLLIAQGILCACLKPVQAQLIRLFGPLAAHTQALLYKIYSF